MIVDQGDVFGAGVNVSARVGSLADPGRIAVSAAVRDQVGSRLAVTFVDRGTHRLENIDEPVQVYALVTRDTTVLPARRQRPVMLLARAALVVLLVAIGGLSFLRQSSTSNMAAPVTNAAAPSDSARPIIAILPFVERGGTADETCFADGVTEEVISTLGRFSGLVVLSYSAIAPYRSQTVALDPLNAKSTWRWN